VTARVTGLFVAAISIICAVKAHTWWGRGLIAASFGDFVLRVLYGGRGSFLGSLAEVVAEFFPIKMYPGPPKQVRVQLALPSPCPCCTSPP
jgi:hypothetical protein